MSKRKAKYDSIYWRQFMLTAGMVLLTLALLGVSFFALSYNYAKGEKSEELQAKAEMVAKLAVTYLEADGTAYPADLQQLLYVLLLRVLYFLFSHSHGLLSRFPAYFDLWISSTLYSISPA